MGADRLAFRPRRSFARAAIEFSTHGLIADLGGIDIADPWLWHRSIPVSFVLENAGYRLFAACGTGGACSPCLQPIQERQVTAQEKGALTAPGALTNNVRSGKDF